ncbi:hypothetical protein ART_3818 [Arthrobacter sp. PAMC 25486]|uniref:PH domain-containing protein n=1 Tax=Arthrobacter sp. PAMC 25486 TaxID=1494608 RepID=UPI000535EBF0|nr:PH domain-containing protein [Arthrobacter sp. PAMC 25486]AIY03417.1 hypothetical protein ART_3818 [Arthrobacter sp. PAMC 25486]
MENAPAAPRTTAVYSAPTRVLAVAAWAFCAFFTVNLLMTGSPASIWAFLPWLLLTAWGVHVLLWRPRLLINQDGVRVVNILREHTVPFSELTALRVLHTVSFDTSAGLIPSWGAPGSGRLGPKMQSTPDGSRTVAALPHSQIVVQSAWDAWERAQHQPKHDAGAPSPGQPASQPGRLGKVTSRWNVPAAVVGILLAVLALASTLT